MNVVKAAVLDNEVFESNEKQFNELLVGSFEQEQSISNEVDQLVADATRMIGQLDKPDVEHNDIKFAPAKAVSIVNLTMRDITPEHTLPYVLSQRAISTERKQLKQEMAKLLVEKDIRDAELQAHHREEEEAQASL